MEQYNKGYDVLIITNEMIPNATNWGACQRMYFLAKSLNDGLIKTCVCSIGKKWNNTYGNELTFDILPIPIKNKFFRDFIDSKNDRKDGVKNSNSQENHSLLKSLRSFVKNNKFLFTILNFPDEYIFNEPSVFMGSISRSWVKSSLSQIESFIRNNSIKVIIISCPPFGLFSIAEKLKKSFPNVSIIFDYRDPWNMWVKRSRIARYLENKYLRYADLVVCTNRNLATDTANEYGIENNKVCVIENGYSEAVWSDIDTSTKPKNDLMTITYAGAINLTPSSKMSYRDVTELFSAFEKIIADGKKIRLQFIGTSDSGEYIENLQERLKEHLVIKPSMPNRDANSEMVKSDVLLLIHTANDNSSKYLVSGKLYDYIRAGRYILCIGDKESLHKDIIEKLSIGSYCLNEKDKIYECISKIYDNWLKDNLPKSPVDSTIYSREHQNFKYRKIIEELIK